MALTIGSAPGLGPAPVLPQRNGYHTDAEFQAAMSHYVTQLATYNNNLTSVYSTDTASATSAANNAAAAERERLAREAAIEQARLDRDAAATQSGADRTARMLELERQAQMSGWTKNADGSYTNKESGATREATAEQARLDRELKIEQARLDREAAKGDSGAERENQLALERLRNTGAVDVVGAQGTAAKELADKNNAAALEQLQKTIDAEGGRATQAQKAEMDRLNATLGAASAESAAEREARMRELAASQTGNQALEALKNQGAVNVVNAQNTGAGAIADKNNASALAQLREQITGQQGIASSEQQAELTRLEKQIAADERARTGTQAHASTESAAERQARLLELEKSQSGAAALAELTNKLGIQTEEERFRRAQIQAAQAKGNTDDMLAKFGFTGNATGAAASTAPAGVDSSDIAVEDAAFARAKDKIGATNEAAKRGLAEAMASRGISGSGIEAQQLGAVESAGASQLADVAAGQAAETVKRRYQVADRDAALASTKRGQDVGIVQTLAGALKPQSSGAY